MCLIYVAWRRHPRHRLVVAANRDEFHARPALPVHWWDDTPGVLAGRDLEAGGTWMAVGTGGRFAAITNYPDPVPERIPGAPSRGALVSDVRRRRRAGGGISRPRHRRRPSLQRIQPARHGRGHARVRVEPLPGRRPARPRGIRSQQSPPRHPVAQGDRTARRSWNVSSPAPRYASPISSPSSRRTIRDTTKRPRPTPKATPGPCSGARHGSSSGRTTERGHRPSSCSTRGGAGVFVERSFDSSGAASATSHSSSAWPGHDMRASGRLARERAGQ